MTKGTLGAAPAAVVGVSILVGLASVLRILVTVAIRGRTIGNAAPTNALRIGNAGGSPVRLVKANGRAGAAMGHGFGQIHFTTVTYISVTIGEARGAFDATRSSSTSGGSVVGITRIGATVAMSCRGL